MLWGIDRQFKGGRAVLARSRWQLSGGCPETDECY